MAIPKFYRVVRLFDDDKYNHQTLQEAINVAERMAKDSSDRGVFVVMVAHSSVQNVLEPKIEWSAVDSIRPYAPPPADAPRTLREGFLMPRPGVLTPFFADGANTESAPPKRLISKADHQRERINAQSPDDN